MELYLCNKLNNHRNVSYKTSGSIFAVHGFIPLQSFSSISEQLLAWLLIKQHKAPHVIRRKNKIHN